MPDENTQDQEAPIVDVPEVPEGETMGEYIKRMVAEGLANAKNEETGADPSIKVPKLDHNPQTPEEVQELGKMFAEYRAEVAALRQELQAHRPRTVNVAATQETPEQRHEARMALIADSSHYCPACGTLSKYPRQCVGPDPRFPSHAPVEMVTTDELGGDPAKHTRAPSTDLDQPDRLAA